ncbi:hypothetical protein BYT27DRAFT_6705449 [Phlegmacium glaucopus]|nr:hypothetical protein BYT27DRAFT_6705449 [Phlegmacium glaucopus]
MLVIHVMPCPNQVNVVPNPLKQGWQLPFLRLEIGILRAHRSPKRTLVSVDGRYIILTWSLHLALHVSLVDCPFNFPPKVYYVLCVGCAPLPFDVELPEKYDQADGDRVHEAARIANLQIDAMHKVVKHPHLEEHHKILVNTFGENYNIKAIRKHVNTLKHGTVKLSDLRDDSSIADIWKN